MVRFCNPIQLFANGASCSQVGGMGLTRGAYRKPGTSVSSRGFCVHCVHAGVRPVASRPRQAGVPLSCVPCLPVLCPPTSLHNPPFFMAQHCPPQTGWGRSRAPGGRYSGGQGHPSHWHGADPAGLAGIRGHMHGKGRCMRRTTGQDAR